MSDISPRRRLTGRAAIAATFLAVPLTASVYYSEALASDAPEPPTPPAAAAAPEAPTPPAPPAPPAPPEVEAELDEVREELIEIERELAEDGKQRVVRREVRVNGKDWEGMSAEERAEFREQMAELRAKFDERGEFRVEMEKVRKQFAEGGELRREIMLAVEQAQAASAEASANAPRVVMKCVDKTSLVTTDTDSDGKTVMFVCEANATKLAHTALKTARAAIESESSLTAEQRAEALRSIDEEIANLKSES